MTFGEILTYHLSKYPELDCTDAVKLAYQASLGGGHMIPSPEGAMARLFAEYESLEHTSEPISELTIEALGEFSRVYIDSLLNEAQLALIGKIFVESANLEPLCAGESFDDRLAVIRRAALLGRTKFTVDEYDRYLADYRASGCPAVSHSERYREHYRPAYRVIDSRFVPILPLIFRIGELLTQKSRVILAIDGRAASGKSTAAELIASLFKGEIIHADDFFLPFEMRTPERLSEPGGNLDRERFAAEVVASLPGAVEYRVFDCGIGALKPSSRKISGDGLLIIEGCYSLHPEFGHYYDLSAFMSVEPEVQKRRILARNGEKMLVRFVNDWIPMEERYFAHFGIEKKCDFIVCGE